MSEAKKSKERKKLRTLRFLRGWGPYFFHFSSFFSLSTQLFAQWEERRKRKQKLASKANWPKVESKTQNYFFSSAANTHTHRHTYSFGCMYVCSQQALRREGKSRAGKESCLRLRRRLLTVTATAGHNGHTHTHTNGAMVTFSIPIPSAVQNETNKQ